MESALAGVTAGNGAIYAVRRDAYLPLAPSGSHDLSFPFALAKRGLRSLYAPAARARGEDGADPGGRVRPQTADDGRALGHRRRRRDALPARLLAAVRLRDRLAPAAALPQPVPAPRRPRSPTWSCSARAGSTPHLRPPAGAARRGPARPLAAARAAARRPLLRDDDRLDRRRPLGPLRATAPPGAGRRRRGPADAARLRHPHRRPGAGPPLALPARRRDRDQARQPRPGDLPPAPRRPRRPRVRDAEAADDGRRAPTRSASARSSTATTRASPAPAASCAAPRSTRSPTWSTSSAARWRSSARARRSPPRSTTTPRASAAATRSCRGSPAGPRSRAAPASPGRSGSSSTSGTSTTAPLALDARILARTVWLVLTGQGLAPD